MKILQINCVYPHGSTGRLTQAIHHHLQERGAESLVCYGRGAGSSEPDCLKLCPEIYAKGNHLLAQLRGTPYGGCLLSTNRLIRILKQHRPDVVHLQCINGYFVNLYRLITWLKGHRVKTVLTLHAEFMYTANCAHAMDCEKWKTGCGNCPRFRQETESLFWDGTARSFRKMQKAFRGFEENLTVVSVSSWLQRRAMQSLILKDMPHVQISNGVDTTQFFWKPVESGKSVIFYATAMFNEDPAHGKGGYYVLQLARRLRDLPVTIVVAGKYSQPGSLPENVVLLGEIRQPQQMAEYYRRANLTLLTSRRESFSMVCGESLCCGTPVVGFQAGAPEQIALQDYSEFVPFGDLDALEGAVRRWLKKDVDKQTVSAAARDAYDLKNMLRRYEALYQRVTEDEMH